MSAATLARLASSSVLVAAFAPATCAMAFAAAWFIPVSWLAAAASASARPDAIVEASCLRYSPGAVAACTSACFLAWSAPRNSGSLEVASVLSEIFGDAICASTWAGPAASEVSSADRGGGIATSAPTFPVGGGPGSGAIGTAGLGTAPLESGAASAASLIAACEASLPCLTFRLPVRRHHLPCRIFFEVIERIDHRQGDRHLLTRSRR